MKVRNKCLWFREYNINSIIIPENYIVIVTDKEEFTKIVKDNYSKKSKAIIYTVNGFKYLIDSKADIVIQCQIL